MNLGKCWTKEEDVHLKHLYEVQNIQKWSTIADEINKNYQVSSKTGKQCRQRYYNSLAPFILKKEWTQEEQEELFRLHDALGNRWTQIASKLPGRAHNCVKNRFYAQIRKSLRKLNRCQRQLKIKSVKPVKIQGVIKILSIGYRGSDEVRETLSLKCLEIKNQLLLFQHVNPESENFRENLIKLYKAICYLTTQLRNHRLGKSKISAKNKLRKQKMIKVQEGFDFAEEINSNQDQNIEVNEELNQTVKEEVVKKQTAQKKIQQQENQEKQPPSFPIQNSYFGGFEMFNQPNFGVSIPIYNPVTIMNPFERYQTPQVPYSGYYIPNFSYCQTFGTNLPTNEK